MKINVKRTDAIRLHSHWVLYFHEVMQAGSIRGAAKELNVAPSAISRKLKEIEGIVGGKLMERTPQGLRLTAAGELVADHVSQVLRGLGRMQNSLDDLRGLRRGHVTIASVPSAAPEFLPQIVSSFRKIYPRITFTCDFVGSRRVVELVKAGDVDIGICYNPPTSRALRTIISVPVPFGAIMSPESELAQSKRLRLYDLVDAGVPFIFPDESISTRSKLDRLLSDSGLEVQPATVSSNRDFIVAMAQFGAGVAFQTTMGIERELRDGVLAFLPLAEPALKPSQLTILVPALRPQAASASLVAEALRAGAAELLK